MKRLFFYSLCLLSLLACNSSPDVPASPKTNDLSQSPIQLPEGQLVFEEIGSAVFAQTKGDSLQKLLVQQFCEESKGYRSNIWLGLNKCSWAIEKYRLDQSPDIIQRHGNELNVVLPNGEKLSFIHDLRDSNNLVYYQFQRYLPENNFLFIEKIAEKQCPQHLLINQKTGQQVALNGTVYWAPAGNAFLLQGHKETCNATIEYWTLSPEKAHQDWSVEPSNWNMEEVKWLSPEEWLIALDQEGKQSKASKYIKLKWLRK